jgi:CO/xanthine dehydrogenase Mo-binding subunit
MSVEHREIGKSIKRLEGRNKLTGGSIYVDDFSLDGMIHGCTIRSPKARGKIKKINFVEGVNWDEFTIVRAEDIPGDKIIHLIVNDQPWLAEDRVNHPEEPILLIAHPDKNTLIKGRSLITIDIEVEDSIHSIEDSLNKKHIVWGEDNIQKRIDITKGDVNSVWAEATHIIEGEYSTGAQEQLYIETNGMIGVWDKDEGVTIYGSLQCPYYIHAELQPLFGLGGDKVRIIQMETGGGFGGKEEYPSIIAGHAALLSYKSGKPVKIVYDRAEDFVATTKRHPSRTKLKTAHDKNGKLLAIDMDFALDGGAYATLSSVVLSRGAIHAAGPYKCDNTNIVARSVATNCPPHGAFRGFGAPQSIFAMERHMDVAAKKLGLSPVEIRRRNFINKGDLTATSQEVRDPIIMDDLFTEALEKADYEEKRKAHFEFNKVNEYKKRGIGFSTFYHGAGFTGSGEKALMSIVDVEATKTGVVRILAASTEIGQGKNTVFAQIAADALGLSYEDIEIAQPDTKFVPDSGPTVASRTSMVVGGLVQKACLNLREILFKETGLTEGYSRIEFKNSCAEYFEKNPTLKATAQYEQPKHIQWDDNTYKGDAYATFAWAIYVADVEIDLVTYETKVVDFVALQEVGNVLNPVMAHGQIVGGVAQAIGYAIYERCNWDKGHLKNGNMTNYIMPSSADLPSIRTFFAEQDTPYGPGRGVKGIGELPMDGAAPAILNAINEATGLPVVDIPLLPEDLLKAAMTSEVRA